MNRAARPLSDDELALVEAIADAVEARLRNRAAPKRSRRALPPPRPEDLAEIARLRARKGLGRRG